MGNYSSSRVSRLANGGAVVAGLWLYSVQAIAAGASSSGHVTDPQGRAVSGTQVELLRRADASRKRIRSDTEGGFAFSGLDAGEYRIAAESEGFPSISMIVQIQTDETATVDVHFSRLATQRESVTVTADVGDVSVLSPDPATLVLVRQETLDANPGRPGMPISIPGMPVESPAGGIKPPQYFVPGVAGDHGEPIAQFFQIGGYLFPNNLPANAHGNGYADPNTLIPIAIESVETDGGAFNVREGNNSVNAAMTFGLRERLEPMVRVTADYRDIDVVTGWSPKRPEIKEWIGLEFSFGNGFLDRLEHRKQYKINASRVFTLGKHDLTIYGIGYHGFSFLPGLIPVGVRVPNDTYDSRQREEASAGIAIVNDVWHLSPTSQIQTSGYLRNYYLDVRPNFGNGWLRQTETRTANSESLFYTNQLSRSFSFLAGFDHRRDAPHDLFLYHFDEAAKAFRPTTGNNLNINFLTPYASVDGALTRYVHYNLGIREDRVFFDTRDLLTPGRSFTAQQNVSSPKGTLSFLPPDSMWLPGVSLSYGQAFHTNDPRIGVTGITGNHTIISKARAYQLVIRKTVAKTDLKVTLAHVTTAQQLARINNDTGLQEDEGPGIIKSIVFSARRDFGIGSLQGSFARADARDRLTGEPAPEAPRLIWDVLGVINRLPFHLQARGEYEHVGRKPLGDGFVAVPVREFRGAVIRTFESKGIDIGLNLFLASGYGGQTLETLALAGEGEPFERITGFPLRSYVTASFTYRLRRRNLP